MARGEGDTVTDDAPDTVTLRVARVVYLMTLGRTLTTGQIADLTGLSLRGALALMDRMAASHHVPVSAEDGPRGLLTWRIEPPGSDWAW